MVGALAFQSLILSSIPGRKPVFLIAFSACVSRPSIYTYITRSLRIFTSVCIFFREEVNKSYRQLAVLLHPDKNQAPGSAEAFKALAQAREELLTNR